VNIPRRLESLAHIRILGVDGSSPMGEDLVVPVLPLVVMERVTVPQVIKGVHVSTLCVSQDLGRLVLLAAASLGQAR
jgi:hypothetical protein